MGQPKRILIVDDEEFNRELLEGIVESFGFESETAVDGAQALQMLSPQIDLVLMDAMMPGMNGFEATRCIRADDRFIGLPIVMTTALTNKEDRLRAVEAGANDFVTKPIDRTELRVRMASLLKMKEAQDAIKQHQEELRRANAELRAKNEQMQSDLDLAREIQQSFIFRQYPTFPHTVSPGESALKFCHYYQPTTTLGGDFFDVLALSDTCAGIFICDVMGHGVRSALVTAMMRALVGERNAAAPDPGLFLGEINRHLMSILQTTRAPMFASAFYLVADVASGKMRYANAGHPSPLWLRHEKEKVEFLSPHAHTSGPALGLFEDAVYNTLSCSLGEGDVLLLFTDGLVEVDGADGEYGEERLLQEVQRRVALPLPRMFDVLLAQIRAYATNPDFEDDVCLVGMQAARLKIS